jgi:hypothetical protein
MNNKMLFFALFVAYNAYSTEIWLHNGYKTPIIYKLNQTEHELAAGNRIVLAVHEKTSKIILHPEITTLAVRTTTKGSLYYSLMSKIKEITNSLLNNSELQRKDAVLIINPNPVMWDIKISWEDPTRQSWETQKKDWKPTGESYAQAQQKEQQQYLEKMTAFFRTLSVENIFMSIIKDKILGVDYAQKTAAIYNAAYYNQNNQNYMQLYWNIMNFINGIRQTFARMSSNQQLDSIVRLKEVIDINYKMYQVYLR